MVEQEQKKAVIYARVSSKKQVLEGNSLENQELRCRQWCKNHGYEIVQLFIEKGISGDKSTRPAFRELLSFLAANAKKGYILLVDDLNRFARNKLVHFSIKEKLRDLGHSLQSVNMFLDDTEESEVMEGIASILGEYERKKNAKRTKNYMLEHAKQGHWVLQPPPGYKITKRERKVYLERKEPAASIIQEALEGFASARFPTPKAVREFLQNHPKIKETTISPTFNFVRHLLRNPRYTGFFAYPRWGIPFQRWEMDAVISLETFQAIQDRLNGKKQVVPCKYDLKSTEFPLRRWVKCAACGEHLTASKPTNKLGKRYAYYHCCKKGCPMNGKGIKPEVLHSDFEDLLTRITPQNQLLDLSALVFRECYDAMTEDSRMNLDAKRARLEAIEEEKQKALKTLMNTGNDEVRAMCEIRITELKTEKIMIEESIENEKEVDMPFPEALAYSMKFISAPREIWASGDYYQRRGVLNLCFKEQISYEKGLKFETPKLSPIFAIFEEKSEKGEVWRARQDSNL